MPRLALALTGLMLVLPNATFAEDGPAANEPDKWRELSGDGDRAEQADGKAKTFRGKLEAVPDAGGPSILQRTVYYRLNGTRVFTGGRRLKPLDDLVGKRVEIRGKFVTMSLEGQTLREIWPSAVRPASGVPDDARLERSGTLAGCRFELSDASGDIAGPAFGNGELLLNVTVTAENRSEQPREFTLEGFVRDAEGTDHEVDFKHARSAKMWDGRLKPGETDSTILYHKSQLKVGGRCHIIIGVQAADGETLWLKSAEIRPIVAG